LKFVGSRLTLRLTTHALSKRFALTPIQAFREFCAGFLVRSAESNDARLIAACASVVRERYVGKAPWPVFGGSGYIEIELW